MTNRTPFRSHRTPLSDDQILLMDFVFDCRAQESALRASAYAAHLNVPYTHRLSDDELHEALHQLRDDGILEISTTSGRRLVSLTAHGGALWEAERLPDWERYVRDEVESKDDIQILSVCAASTEVAREFLEVASSTRLHDIQPDAAIPEPLGEFDLIYWRSTPGSVVFRARVGDQDLRPDWDDYRKRLAWWRTLDELAAFRQKASSA